MCIPGYATPRHTTRETQVKGMMESSFLTPNVRVYFGFSHTVNVAMGGMPGTKGRIILEAAIKAVPDDRVLIESDVMDDQDVTLASLHALQLVADCKGWSVRQTAEVTAKNALAFLGDRDDGAQ